MATVNKAIEFTPTIHHSTYPFISSSGSLAHRDLFGKSVLITGASRGIGKAIAISFARAGAAFIFIAARNLKDLDDVEKLMVDAAKERGREEPRILKAELDVTNPSNISQLVQTLETANEPNLDILINNAGTLGNFKPIVDSDPEGWWNVWEVNVKGAYMVTRALLPLLMKGGEGIVVNVSSSGIHNRLVGGSAYTTSKLAVLRFTEFIQAEYGSKGILAFAIHPGRVLTDMALSLPPETRSLFIDPPELAADTLVWLTRERREWLAGRYISVTWDMEELEGMKEEILEKDMLKVRMVV